MNIQFMKHEFSSVGNSTEFISHRGIVLFDMEKYIQDYSLCFSKIFVKTPEYTVSSDH